ncbi:MAG: DUF4446 family protein [Mycobacteriales bacterium]
MSDQILQVTAFAGVGIGAIGLGLATLALRRLSRLRRSQVVLEHLVQRPVVAARPAQPLPGAGDGAADQRIDDDVRTELIRLRGDVAKAVCRVGMVRYDAFAEMAGRTSFSVALLDLTGQGLVLSAINTRSEARVYAKNILKDRSDVQLSPEEREAIDRALNGQPGLLDVNGEPNGRKPSRK